MNLSVVILSRDARNLVPCVQAILKNEPGFSPRRIIVVDDGAKADAEGQLPNATTFIAGEKPFIFARNANIGIQRAAPDDVLLLNDDALLTTPGGITALWCESIRERRYGVISAASDNVGNVNQHPQGGFNIREDPRMVCFIAVLIPRSTITTVGLLDERYTGYGMDDDDYCLRVRKAGLKIGIWDRCVVDHGSLTSSYRGESHASFVPNLRLFIAKWGVDNRGLGKEQSEFKELFA